MSRLRRERSFAAEESEERLRTLPMHRGARLSGTRRTEREARERRSSVLPVQGVIKGEEKAEREVWVSETVNMAGYAQQPYARIWHPPQ